MRGCVAVILVSVVAAGSALAENKWEPMRGVADVYPSEQSAIESVVDEFVAQLHESERTGDITEVVVAPLPEKESGVPALPDGNVNVSGTWGSAGISVSIAPSVTREAFLRAQVWALRRLTSKLPEIQAFPVQMPQALAPNQAALRIAVGEVESVEQSDPIVASGDRGRIKAIYFCGGISREINTQFRVVPWVQDINGFISRQNNKSWVIGLSKRLLATPQDAINSACEDAAVDFATQARAWAQVNGNFISYQTIREISQSRFKTGAISDKFVQRIENPTGYKYRAAVLVASDANNFVQIVPSQGMTMRVQSTRAGEPDWINVKSVAVMVMVIVGLYFFLRGATRGFFSRQGAD
jgi:hypothetical protein